MRFVNQLSVLVKIAIPLVALATLTIGLVLYARTTLNSIADQSRHVIEVLSVRQEAYLTLQLRATEAALRTRNITQETDAARLANYK